MPKKNPYLTQYKENISTQQQYLRQKLGQPLSSVTNEEKPTQGGSKANIPNHDVDDFPSIDDEAPNDNISITASRAARETANRNRYSYFNNDAEESLQFFKKNLLPTNARSTTELVRQNPQVVRPTGAATFDRQPSLSSVKGESAYVARSRAPLEVTETSRTTSGLNNNYKYPSNRPLPLKLEPQTTQLNDEQQATDKKLTTTTRRLPLNARDEKNISSIDREESQSVEQTLPQPPPVQMRTKSSNERQKSHSSTRQPSPSAKVVSLGESASRNQNARAIDSPVPSETFSRKPIYNSLLRAHDSIRLKVNRPKVRPKSESGTVNDTELDDTIQLEEISTSGFGAISNERAVDVKRRSSKKNKKKEPNTDQQKNNDDSPTPIRNFSEVRVVRIVRNESERSLGVTVRAEDGNIVVARILAGSLADKQGALQVGDVILAVNNREVYTPEQLQEQLRKTINDDTLLLKVVPSFREELPTLCIYLRALFNYDPNEDSLLPCKEVGVSFNQGDILEVVNQEDPNWWQARRVESENLQTGLIPSQELEERRRAFVIPDFDLATRTSICGTKVSRKSKKKEIYNVGQNCDFDKAELQLYEEVCRTPAFERRTLVLIGANGVGKQGLKSRLISMDPDRFGTPLPHTSRLPRDGEEDGVHYHFVTREKMEDDIIAGKYLEYGEYDGALYGTKLDSLREIIGSGRVCVLDCSPTCLKVLKTSDYLPFVAFIAAPTLDQLRFMQDWNRGNKTYATFDRALSRQSRRAKTLQDFAFDFFEDEDLQLTVEESARLFRLYENYFDVVIVNNNFERTFEQLRDSIDALSVAPQWIPISWIYGT